MRKIFGSVRGGTPQGLFVALEEAKGITAESHTLRVLNGSHKPTWLAEARHTPEQDKQGVDMELVLTDGTVVPVNIKSSERGLHDHIRKRKKLKGRFIIVVIVRPNYTDKQIIESVTQSLKPYGQGKFRHKKGITKK